MWDAARRLGAMGNQKPAPADWLFSGEAPQAKRCSCVNVSHLRAVV